MPTKTLLGCGVAAGVLVPALILADGSTRPGYSLWHHGASQLGTGERWWLLTLTFVIGGLLLIAFSAGLHRVLPPGRAATWGPVLTATAGVCLVVAGVIPTDPALGYPPGEPEVVTVAGRVHGLIGLILFVALSAAGFVLARRLGEAGRGWAAYSRISGTLVIVLAFAAGIAYRLDVQGILRPAPAGLLEHASLLIGLCWIAALGARLSRSAQPA
jgi:Protein of unknown function (DUF998)